MVLSFLEGGRNNGNKKDAIMDFLFKSNDDNGSLSVIKLILGVSLACIAGYTVSKERGWLRKKSLKDQHIFLTGAGSGLGRSLALRFAAQQAKLTLSDINEAGVLETKKMIKDLTGRDDMVVAIKLDVCDKKAIEEAAQHALTDFGPVDILINNAGIVQGRSFLELDDNLTHKQFVVNLECHFWTVKQFLPKMMENGGQIVAVASMAGQQGTPNLVDYSAAKAGVIGMMEGLRLELKAAGRNNIVCTTVCPFFINTGMFHGVKESILFPFLDQEYVVNRVYNAIVQNEEHVDIPWRMGLANHLNKALFPAWVIDYIVRFCVGWDAMESFEGRGKEGNAIFHAGNGHSNGAKKLA